MKKVLLAVFVCGVGVSVGMLAYAVDSKESTKDNSLVSNGNCWNNGNYMILGRVPKGLLPKLDSSDWEFFAGSDEKNNPTWTKTKLPANAYGGKPIFQHRGYTSMNRHPIRASDQTIHPHAMGGLQGLQRKDFEPRFCNVCFEAGDGGVFRPQFTPFFLLANR